MENNEVHLEVEKSFTAGVDELYDAWISPEKLKQWWKPAGNQLKEVQNDVKQGGHILYAFQTKDGEDDLKITGDYKEVEPGKKLVYSWNWELPHTQAVPNNEFQLTIEFSGEQEGSKIKVTQENFKDQEAIHPHREGWYKALNDLHDFLS